MYICICKAVTEKQIRNAAESGVTSMAGLKDCLGVASNCGSCEEAASAVLSEYREKPSNPILYTPSRASLV